MSKERESQTLSRRALLSAFASAGLLQACGGGGDAGVDGGGSATAPAIVTQPADASVRVGAAATFAVVASGGAPLTYQWLQDGAAVAGATGESFTIGAAALADHGTRFAVVVTNAAGSVTSRAATLSVLEARGVAVLAGRPGGAGHLDGAGAAARFDQPDGVAVSAAGEIFVSSGNVIRRITPSAVVTTFAGKYAQAGAADGVGAAARFGTPSGMCFDGAGFLYVADYTLHTIRRISPAGEVTTFAGSSGTGGVADGVGANARFFGPLALVSDGAGNIFVADTANHAIRKITAAGVVTTFAGSPRQAGATDGTGAAARFNFPAGLAVDDAGNLYVADTFNHRIRKVTPGGVVTTLAGSIAGSADGAGAAAQFRHPRRMAIAGGLLYVADSSNNEVRAVTLDGRVSTVAGALDAGQVDGMGAAARFSQPTGIGADAAGNLYVSDRLAHTLRKITPAGAVTTFAGAPEHAGGTDGVGTAARLQHPFGVAMDQAGNVYVADTPNHTIRKITPDGAATTLAGVAGQAGWIDGPAGAARFSTPYGVAVDAAGNVYVGDSANNVIRKITPGGQVTTLAGNGVPGFVDGTGAAAEFSFPTYIAVDAGGTLHVSDTGNHAIRKVTQAGVATTTAGSGALGSNDDTGAAATFNTPMGITIDAAGVLFVCDKENMTIRRIAPDGAVTTFAGAPRIAGSTDGTGPLSRFRAPFGIAADANGNLYVADSENCLIRKVDAAADVTTPFGQSGSVGVQMGVPGAFNMPTGIASNAAGTTLWVADSNENAVLRIVVG